MEIAVSLRQKATVVHCLLTPLCSKRITLDSLRAGLQEEQKLPLEGHKNFISFMQTEVPDIASSRKYPLTKMQVAQSLYLQS